MTRTSSFAVLLTGIVLIDGGVIASASIGADLAQFFSGTAISHTVTLLLGGGGAALVGFVGLSRQPGAPR